MKHLKYCLFVALALALSLNAHSDDFIVYGAFDGYPKYFVQDGEAKGIVVDITKSCLAEMQLPFRIKLVPWKRAYSQAEKGKGGVIGLSKSDERLAIFDFSEPIFTEHIVLVVKKGRAFPFEKISDLKGKLIGVTNGTSYGSAYDQAIADGTMTIVGYNDIYSGLAMLQFERTDALLLGSSVDLAKLALEDSRLKPELLEMLPVPFKSDSKYLGISKALNMRDQLDRFDACLLRGHASGDFNAIILEYAVD